MTPGRIQHYGPLGLWNRLFARVGVAQGQMLQALLTHECKTESQVHLSM